LGEAVELDVKVERSRLTVAEELCFHGTPGVPCGDGVGEVVGVGVY